MIKIFYKIFALGILAAGLAAGMPDGGYAQETVEENLSCDKVKALVQKEELSGRIFKLKEEEVFHLPEIADNDKVPKNIENESCWKCSHKESCKNEEIGGYAKQLGELFAEILKERQKDSEELKKLLVFIDNVLKQFQKANFKTVLLLTYNSFIEKLKNENDYDQIKQAILSKEINYVFSDFPKGKDKCMIAIERFEAIKKAILNHYTTTSTTLTVSSTTTSTTIADSSTTTSTTVVKSGSDSSETMVFPKSELIISLLFFIILLLIVGQIGGVKKMLGFEIEELKLKIENLTSEIEKVKTEIERIKKMVVPVPDKDVLKSKADNLLERIAELLKQKLSPNDRSMLEKEQENIPKIKKGIDNQNKIEAELQRTEQPLKDIDEKKVSPLEEKYKASCEQNLNAGADESKQEEPNTNQNEAKPNDPATDQKDSHESDLKESIGKRLEESISKKIEGILEDRFRIFQSEFKPQIIVEESAIYSAILKIEQNLLSGKWEEFIKDNKALVDSLCSTKRDNDFFYKTISELPKLLTDFEKFENYKKLPSRYDELSAPLREYHEKTVQVLNIHNYFNSTEKRELDISTIRKHSQLLTALENFREVKKLRDFRIDKWIREYFLEVADRIFCRYQEVEFEKRGIFDEKDGSLKELLKLAEEILSAAKFKYIPIKLGEDVYDGKIHIARSTTNNPSFSNRAIMSVIRNGFKQEEKIFQQPEVIINKIL